MNATTTDALQPSYPTITGKPDGSSDYLFVIGFFTMVLLLLALAYASYIYKRSRSPPSNDADADNRYLVTFSRGLEDDVLLTFPTFLYSQATLKGDANASACSICLTDYKAADVVRLLPECGHLFHRKCIDTWLKAHPTCPVCRNSPLAGNTYIHPSSQLG